ncbi:MAG: FAD-dependent oxidoreductase [Ornithinibacter sp.]
MSSPRFVVVGGGPAAGAAARRFAEAGERVLVLTREPIGPYDRTVLSKTVLLDDAAEVPSVWPPGVPWRELIDVRPLTTVTELHPDAGELVTQDGDTWPFESLVLAPGAEPRRLVVTGADGPGIHHLRDCVDARGLAAALGGAGRLVVVGGGVIGLEVAAAAAQRGLAVTVVEAGTRVLGRGVPPPVADWLADLHTRHGVSIRVGVSPQEVLRDGTGITGVHLSDGSVAEADVVAVGIGISPRTELAEAAGLVVADGIVVDTSMRTSHPAVLAAGDAVRLVTGPGDRGIRLESFTAAGRQGEVAAAVAMGGADTFEDVPWSWSDQYDATMQVLGVPGPEAREELVGDEGTPVVLSLDEAGRLVGVCGAGTGPGVARPVRAAAAAVARRVVPDLVAARAAGGDLRALTTVLHDAGRG